MRSWKQAALLAAVVCLCFVGEFANAGRRPDRRLGAAISGGGADSEAPTDGAALTCSNHATVLGRVDCSWNAATDDVGVDHYRVVFLTGATAPAATCSNGTEIHNGAGTSVSHTSLTNQLYSYRACAYDEAANVSAGITDTSNRPFTNTHSFNPDGSLEYITVPDHASLNSDLDNHTACFWARETTWANNDALIGKTNTGQREWSLRVDGTDAQRLIACINDTVGVSSCPTSCSNGTDVLANNTAAFICMVYDGTQGTANNRVQFYTNAVIDATKTCFGTIPANHDDGTEPLQIAAGPGAGNFYGPGFIDQVSFWSVSLTQSDINVLCCGVAGGCGGACTYATARPEYTGISGLVSFWAIDGDTHPTATDSVGSNHGTYTNTEAGDISTTVP